MYEGLSYKLSLKFPSSYPYTAPQVKFETPCFHPNVDQYGNICLDILKDKWSAVYNVRTILLSVQSLLGGPCVTGVCRWVCVCVCVCVVPAPCLWWRASQGSSAVGGSAQPIDVRETHAVLCVAGAEPNNDSPLNGFAAQLWDNQEGTPEACWSGDACGLANQQEGGGLCVQSTRRRC